MAYSRMAGRTLQQLTVDLAGLTACVAEQEDVLAAYLYGSVARGQADSLSDVDVAVLFAPGADAEALTDRQTALMVELDRFSSCPLQVTVLNHAPPQLAYEVIRDGWLLFERDPLARIRFEVLAMRRYFDIRPMLEAYDRALARRIQEVGLGTRRRRHPGALGAAERVRERHARTEGS